MFFDILISTAIILNSFVLCTENLRVYNPGISRKLGTEKHPESPVSPYATRGMVIDAGSGGSRLHIFRWEPRVFNTIPPPLSYPFQDENWTDKIRPGIADLAKSAEDIVGHLVELLNFAKYTLAGQEAEFAMFPIWFKATGGMRQIPLAYRKFVMHHVRTTLSNKTICPFYFSHDMARVISGEEEAIYSWAAVNFLFGNLAANFYHKDLGSDDQSNDGGIQSNFIGPNESMNATFGTLDLGGASSQIAFFVPSQDISEGLFKFQLGGQKHWNVYTKSFLQFGHVSARIRYVTGIAEEAIDQKKHRHRMRHLQYITEHKKHHHTHQHHRVQNHKNRRLQMNETKTDNDNNDDDYSNDITNTTIDTNINLISNTDQIAMHHSHHHHHDNGKEDDDEDKDEHTITAKNACFFSGYDENVKPSSPNPFEEDILFPDTIVLMSGPDNTHPDQFYACLESIRPLLVKYNNKYCDIVYDGQCSINGAYQPSVRDQKYYIGTSSYTLPWDILLLPTTSSLSEYKKKAIQLCTMSFKDVKRYYEKNNLDLLDDKLYDFLPDFCFLVTYSYALLTEGYGFHPNASLTVLDQVRGYKVGWALGAILYEINTLPWLYEPVPLNSSMGLLYAFVYYSIVLVVGIVVGVLYSLYMINEAHDHHGITSRLSSPFQMFRTPQRKAFHAYQPINNFDDKDKDRHDSDKYLQSIHNQNKDNQINYNSSNNNNNSTSNNSLYPKFPDIDKQTNISSSINSNNTTAINYGSVVSPSTSS